MILIDTACSPDNKDKYISKMCNIPEGNNAMETHKGGKYNEAFQDVTVRPTWKDIVTQDLIEELMSDRWPDTWRW